MPFMSLNERLSSYSFYPLLELLCVINNAEDALILNRLIFQIILPKVN
ncbi:Uncharacterised protein [Legionella gratiana]|uniref:Uncharacterized protein n=1 Tax=Legionella gratiana TaxID=45066 RepID=A0A378JGT1_9GAMM|nr:Uncharacterised protein [Legionella gratiana]